MHPELIQHKHLMRRPATSGCVVRELHFDFALGLPAASVSKLT